EGGADARAHERRLRQRGVADPLGPELLEQAHADGEAAAVGADVLAHEEHPLVTGHRLADRGAEGLAVGGLHGTTSPVTPGLVTKRVSSSTGSRLPASAKATASSTSAATSASMPARSSG